MALVVVSIYPSSILRMDSLGDSVMMLIYVKVHKASTLRAAWGLRAQRWELLSRSAPIS